MRGLPVDATRAHWTPSLESAFTAGDALELSVPDPDDDESRLDGFVVVDRGGGLSFERKVADACRNRADYGARSF